jgi:two-component sensor histidine kinase
MTRRHRKTFLLAVLGALLTDVRGSTASRTSVCDQASDGCPVRALHEALARESDLLQQKDALIQEQELLRKESDHRLLNGLQMVVSLLSMQTRAALNPEVATQLSVAASRVATIERVHRRLHSYDDTQTVALKQYLEEFCHDFRDVMASDDGPDRVIAVEGCEIDLPTSTAIPVGFIVNELVTNAVKYGGRGRIVVALQTQRSNGYVLSVSNDGPSLPDDFDPVACTGLGMKIVGSLVRKIGGEFRFGPATNGQGVQFSVHFS